MSEPVLLIAYRAMPSSVLEERMRMMQKVLDERQAVMAAPEHWELEPQHNAISLPEGTVVDMRGQRQL